MEQLETAKDYAEHLKFENETRHPAYVINDFVSFSTISHWKTTWKLTAVNEMEHSGKWCISDYKHAKCLRLLIFDLRLFHPISHNLSFVPKKIIYPTGKMGFETLLLK